MSTEIGLMTNRIKAIKLVLALPAGDDDERAEAAAVPAVLGNLQRALHNDLNSPRWNLIDHALNYVAHGRVPYVVNVSGRALVGIAASKHPD